VHHDGEKRGLRSAVLVSVLWGLWHMPVAVTALRVGRRPLLW